MSNYIIYTDSACDLSKEILDSWGVKFAELSFKFSGSDEVYRNSMIPPEEIYARMRKGETGKTSAVNIEEFKDIFRVELERGNDVLYLAFSSGLSNTYNAARLAAEELLEEFSENRVIAVDTLCASAGQGLLLHFAVEKKTAGQGIEDVARFVMDAREHLCHWFTVDDLKYLKAGGRVSATTALVGTMLNIKPVLHMDDEGHLINKAKVRGRRAALSALLEKYDELAIDKTGEVYICQADCMDDAEFVKRELTEKFGANVTLITPIGPVIGLHAGPGTIAVFFMGKTR